MKCTISWITSLKWAIKNKSVNKFFLIREATQKISAQSKWLSAHDAYGWRYSPNSGKSADFSWKLPNHEIFRFRFFAYTKLCQRTRISADFDYILEFAEILVHCKFHYYALTHYTSILTVRMLKMHILSLRVSSA